MHTEVSGSMTAEGLAALGVLEAKVLAQHDMPVRGLDVEGIEMFLTSHCPQCLEQTLVRVIDQIKPTGVSLGPEGYGLDGEVLRSHIECRGCGYTDRQTTEVQDERRANDDDPA